MDSFELLHGNERPQSKIKRHNGVIHVIDAVLLPPTKDIVDTAISNPNLSTLVAAVKAAGLVDALKGKGPFTVFAPTNAAFAKLGQSNIDALLNDKTKLTSILLYHVLGSEALSKDAAMAGHAATLNGQDVVITSRRGWDGNDMNSMAGSGWNFWNNMRQSQLYINNARVVVRDVLATNGVIHIIDAVLIPPSKDIVDTLASNPEFSTLVAAVKAAGLVDTLKSAGPFTVFAPTNAAFAKLPKGTVDALLKDPATLKNILLYHAISGKVYSYDACKLTSATMANGMTVKIQIDEGELMINNAEVTHADWLTTNGVIHVIDAVLIPPK